jgi:uncharacterized protein YjbI with pentapeptide repeats
MSSSPVNLLRRRSILNGAGASLLLCGALFWWSGADERREKRIQSARATLSRAGDTGEGTPRRHALNFLVRTKQSLAGVDLTSWDLRKMDFSGMELKGTIFSEASLDFANLQTSDLRDAQFDYANLIGANLVRANLEGSEIFHADLNLADFTEANLRNVRFEKVDLAEAKFAGAHLEGATFTDAENLEVRLVKGAVWDETTQWPPGFEKKLGAAGLSREKPSP